MPPATSAYPVDENTEEMRLLDELYQQEMIARQEAFNLAQDYYFGMHKRHLVPDGSNTDDNVTVNLIGLVVDKSVSSLMGTNEQGTIIGPDFEIAEEVDRQAEMDAQPALQKMMIRARSAMSQMLGLPNDQENPAKEYLDDLWEANHKEIFLHDLAINGGTSGHCFVKMDPTHPLDDSDGLGRLFPRLVVLNPAFICKYWDPLDVTRTLWYTSIFGRQVAQQWQVGSVRQDVVRNVNEDGSDAEGWTIYEFKITKQSATWQRTNKVSWDYKFAPIIDFKNLPKANHPYGANDLDINVIRSSTTSIRGSKNLVSSGLVGLNDSINFTLSNIQRIIKLHAHPRTVVTGASADGLTDSSIENLYAISTPDAQVYNLEMQSELTPSFNYALTLRRTLFDQARELDPATVQDKLGQLTNFGLRVLNSDHLGKLGTKRLLYGAGLEYLCQCCLELAGLGQGIEVVSKWPDPLPSDPLATAQALMLDRQNGLSQDTYLERRGYDPQVEAQKREREQAEKVQVQSALQQGQTNDQMVSVGQMQRQMSDTQNGRNVPNSNGQNGATGGNQ